MPSVAVQMPSVQRFRCATCASARRRRRWPSADTRAGDYCEVLVGARHASRPRPRQVPLQQHQGGGASTSTHGGLQGGFGFVKGDDRIGVLPARPPLEGRRLEMRHQMRLLVQPQREARSAGAVQAGLHGGLPTDDGGHWCAPRNFTTRATY